MSYGETKVYFDGSHYIAIPYVPNPKRKRYQPPEELITVTDTEEQADTTDEGFDDESEVEPLVAVPEIEKEPSTEETPVEGKKERKITKKLLFEELYEESKDMKRSARKKYIKEKMLPYFRNEDAAMFFIECQFERKTRNMIARRTRMVRKINLQEFNYFCTFTYDGTKHTEESFQRKLRGCFKMMCHRKGWKYVGVWERSPGKKRLHFHGLFYIPDGSMPGELVEVKDYSPIKKKVQYTLQNTYFNERFGRSDFKEIEDRSQIRDAVAYLTKYIEKSGEKIVYSKGLPQYFISDIMDDDVVCTIGQEDRKLLLFDDFSCFDEGVYIGPVSKETIEKLRKSN